MASDAVTCPAFPAMPRPRAEMPTTRGTPSLIERLARGPGEVDVGGLETLGLRLRRHDPEHRVGAGERLGDDVEVVVRSLHHLDALEACSDRRDGSRTMTRTGSRRWRVVEEVVEDLVADLAGGGGDDDHGAHLVELRRSRLYRTVYLRSRSNHGSAR